MGDITVTTYDENPELVAQIIELLSQSFADDPHCLFFIPDPKHRQPRFRQLMQCEATEAPTHIKHYMLPGGEAAAVLHKEPLLKDSSHDVFSAPGDQSVAPELRSMFSDVGEEMHKRKEQYQQMKGEYFYLAWLGTRKDKQGQGFGGRLLRHLLAEADREGLHCLLAASNLDNRRLYERNGFVELWSKEWRHPSRPGMWCGVWFMERAPLAQRQQQEQQQQHHQQQNGYSQKVANGNTTH